MPAVLTKEEVKAILATVNNVKHKLLLGLLYSSGLRVSEVTNARVEDLNFKNRMLAVRGAGE